MSAKNPTRPRRNRVGGFDYALCDLPKETLQDMCLAYVCASCGKMFARVNGGIPKRIREKAGCGTVRRFVAVGGGICACCFEAKYASRRPNYNSWEVLAAQSPDGTVRYFAK